MWTTRLAAIAVVLQLLAGPARAQDVRTMEFALGAGQKDLAVKVAYEDPTHADPRLGGSRVMTMSFEVSNLSAKPVQFDYEDVRLNVGGNASLAPIGPAAASAEIRRMNHVSPLLGFVGRTSTTFHPHQLQVLLEKQRLKDGSINPGQTKKGLIYFMAPAGSAASAFDGVLWLETRGRPPQMLETKDYMVWTRAPRQPTLAETLRQTWSLYFSSTPPAFNKSYALLIGVGRYQHLNALESPGQDVKKMREYLIAQGFDEVVTITDESVKLETFRQPQTYFKSKLERDDRFLFYYSGHGMSGTENGRPRGYLPLVDEVAGGHARSIPMDSLVSWMKSLSTQHLLVILDSCFSGLAIEGTELKSGDVALKDPRVDQEALQRLSRGPARYLIMAGTAGQLSFGGGTWNGSMFTEMLLKGLRRGSGADLYHDRIVTTRALYVWLKDSVYREAQKANKDLTPLLLDLGPDGVSLGEFVFVQ